MKKIYLLSLVLLTSLAGYKSFGQSFTLPGDGNWYLVATMSGRHAFIEYVYSHSTGHNPSLVKGEIQFINARTFIIQEQQTMGYNSWNQPQFAIINKSNISELWVKATTGVSSGPFEVIYSKYANLTMGNTSDSNLSDNGGSLKIYDKLPDNSHNYTGNLNVMDGKIGIGTTSPSKLLDVNGDARIGNLNSRQYLKISSLEWPEIRFQTPTSNEQIRLGTAHADNSNYGVEEGDLYVYTQTTGKMPFVIRRNGDLRFNLKGGNVGIGTNNTGTHKLSVNGSIRSKEVKVEANWSDFVFYDEYNLRTLEEVEEHINEKGHLPEIPSEAEVTENGINLGEMDAKLLQKIEELTLYMIEMNKQMKSQSTEIEQLKTENSKLQNEISALKTE